MMFVWCALFQCDREDFVETPFFLSSFSSGIGVIFLSLERGAKPRRRRARAFLLFRRGVSTFVIRLASLFLLMASFKRHFYLSSFFPLVIVIGAGMHPV